MKLPISVYEKDSLFWDNMAISSTGCWIPTTKSTAHGKYKIIKRDGIYMSAHRYSFRLFYGDSTIINGHQICHKCDNPPCANPRHLFQGTDKENKLDSLLKGRRDHLNKLTKADVIAIRKAYAKGDETNRSLAKKYKVHHATIQAIIVKRKWKHVA